MLIQNRPPGLYFQIQIKQTLKILHKLCQPFFSMDEYPQSSANGKIFEVDLVYFHSGHKTKSWSDSCMRNKKIEKLKDLASEFRNQLFHNKEHET